MRLAIMQPYFFPYIGYFQLIRSVDIFVVYDNIKYTKKGWINRNRLLQNGKDVPFSLPLEKASDHLDICERKLEKDFDPNKLLNQVQGRYRNAPYFKQTFPLVEHIVEFDEGNLFRFLHHSLIKTCEHLGIKTEIWVSSDIAIDHGLKSQDRVLAICEALGADTYINAIGGMELYSRNEFQNREIELRFIRSKPFEYAQFGDEFVPWLSIIDVMMFNSREKIHNAILENFDLLMAP